MHSKIKQKYYITFPKNELIIPFLHDNVNHHKNYYLIFLLEFFFLNQILKNEKFWHDLAENLLGKK